MVAGQGKGWFLVSFQGYPIGEFLQPQTRADNNPPGKLGSMFLEFEPEKVKQLINQKEKGYLTYGEIDDLLLLNTVFPERSVIR